MIFLLKRKSKDYVLLKQSIQNNYMTQQIMISKKNA